MEDEMGETYSTHRRDENYIQVSGGKLKKRGGVGALAWMEGY
jgi:hypothetical protein